MHTGSIRRPRSYSPVGWTAKRHNLRAVTTRAHSHRRLPKATALGFVPPFQRCPPPDGRRPQEGGR
jgi:hypothetical protein